MLFDRYTREVQWPILSDGSLWPQGKDRFRGLNLKPKTCNCFRLTNKMVCDSPGGSIRQQFRFLRNYFCHLSIMRGKFVCLFVCHTTLAPSVLHGRGPRPRRLSPWALGTCIFTLFSTSFHGQPGDEGGVAG